MNGASTSTVVAVGARATAPDPRRKRSAVRVGSARPSMANLGWRPSGRARCACNRGGDRGAALAHSEMMCRWCQLCTA